MEPPGGPVRMSKSKIMRTREIMMISYDDADADDDDDDDDDDEVVLMMRREQR